MKSVHRDAADEYTHGDGRGFAKRPGAFSAEIDKPVTQTRGNAGHES